jgi:hypothetical protein
MSEGAAPAVSNGAPRNNAGQFSPKAGATGVVPQGETSATTAPPTGATSATNAPPSGPQSPEDWGLEGEVDVYGEKQKVQWKSKAEALREAQELRAYRKRVRDIAEAEKRIQAREQADPEELLRERGISVEELARRKVLEAAKLVDMTPEQQRIHALEQEIAKRDAEREATTKAEQERQARAEAAQRRQMAVEGLEKGLELSGLPKTHHTMALLAEIQQECTAQRLPPLPPELLAQEANRRYNERGVEPLKKLQGKALLERLGPEVIRNILLAERERRGLAAAQPRQASAAPSERGLPEDTGSIYGEAEAEARLRAMRNGR